MYRSTNYELTLAILRWLAWLCTWRDRGLQDAESDCQAQRVLSAGEIASIGDTRDIVPRRKLRLVVTPVAGSVVTVATGAGEASATQFLPDQIAYLMPQ